MSIQRRAGLRGLPVSSRATTVQQVESTQSAETSEGLMAAVLMASRTAVPRHVHQSSGSCSAQEGAGKDVG